TSVDPGIKNYHWLDLVFGLFDAYDRHADTVLIRDSAGHIAEGPGFNVFLVKNGSLKTPASGVLPGITRRTVFDLAAECGIACEQARVRDSELSQADEVFVTSTAGGVMAVTRVDDRPVGDG